MQRYTYLVADGCLLIAGIFYACKYAVYIIQRSANL
nr:MAG TPA: hypothetical protein [Caudoviricetes sp.]